MVLVAKSVATKVMKNGETRVLKGYREVKTKNNRIMYFSDDKSPKSDKKPRKKTLKKKEQPMAVSVEENPDIVSFE